MRTCVNRILINAMFLTGLITGCSGTSITSDDLEAESLNTSGSNLTFIYNSIDSLYGKYVSADRGLVDYPGIWGDPLLKKVRDTIAVFSMDSLETRGDSLAFWINAYNLLVIYYLQDYGLVSQATQGFPLFNRRFYVAGDSITLDELEKHSPNYIKKFNYPLIHFGLVCAAISCPPLKHGAYRGDSVYRQLDRETEEFFNSEEFNPILTSGQAQVSSLMGWYSFDFAGFVRDSASPTLISASPGSTVAAFIRGYLTDPAKIAILDSRPLTYVTYNWEVNTQ